MAAMHTFGLYAPSGLVSDAAVIERAVAHLTALGHRVHIDAGVRARHLRFAGNDSERLAAIERVANHPEVDTALAMRGGYGWTRLLDRLDYAALARSGKRWLGHSDFTAFQLAMLARAGAITFAGPMAAYDFGADTPSEFTRENCFGVLDHASWEIACALDGPVRIACTGTMWGGNLALVVHLVGTAYFPQITGGVLFLEDIAEHPYRIERMLYQLLHTGVLHKQQAILLGTFTDYQPLPNDHGYDFAAAVAHLRSRIDVPIYTGLAFGHVRDKLTLPVGGRCTFDARDGYARLVLSDYGVRPAETI
ncbi:MAG: LD-carboxypeptidase [Casimicrobiaceae bacterium]